MTDNNDNHSRIQSLRYFGKDVDLEDYYIERHPEKWENKGLYFDKISGKYPKQESGTYTQQYYVFRTLDGRTIRIASDGKGSHRDDYPVEIRGIREKHKPEDQRETGPVELLGDQPPAVEIVFADGETEKACMREVQTPPDPPNPDDMIPLAEAVKYSKVTRQTVSKWDKDGLLPNTIGKGRRRLYRRGDLDDRRK